MNKRDAFIVWLIFYLGWFASVLLALSDYAPAAFLFSAALLAVLYRKKQLEKRNLILAFAIFSFGLCFDLFMIEFEFVKTQGASFGAMPIWLISIWLLFAFSMIAVGKQLHPPVWLSALLGFFMGPLSYKSGEAFKVLTFNMPTTLLIYAVFWALFFPLILYFCHRPRLKRTPL